MLGNQQFYHRSIRKVVVAFGTMFNDIEVVRFTKDGTPKERFKVPLSYGAKEKYITRLMADPNLTKSVATVVPRMSFVLNSFEYDTARKQISTIRNFSYLTDNSMRTQYMPVPFDFKFSLSVYVRNTEDGTQILEQILPFFTPDFTVTVDFIPNMDHKYDVPIILNSVNSNIEYEGDLQSTRLITWDLEFTAKAYIWPPIKESGIIREVDVNIHTPVFIANSNNESSNTSSGGGSSNTSNTSSNNTVIGDTTYGKLVHINLIPQPSDAGPDDEYGFAETITIVV